MFSFQTDKGASYLPDRSGGLAPMKQWRVEQLFSYKSQIWCCSLPQSSRILNLLGNDDANVMLSPEQSHYYTGILNGPID